MPGLQWLGRRWRTGSDDFFLSSIVFFSTLTFSGTLILTRFVGLLDVRLRGCSSVPVMYERCIYALGIINCIGATAYLTTGLLSCRGGPFQLSKRRHVGTLLYVTTLVSLGCLPLGSVLLKYSLYDGVLLFCEPFSRRALYSSLLINVIVPLLHFTSLLLSFDPHGGHKGWNSEEYQMLWGRRCQRLNCCLYSEDDEGNVFEDVAATLAAFFQGYDLVPSDIIAGMLLLHDAQTQKLLEHVANIQFTPPEDGCKERISAQARMFPMLSLQQRECVMELRRYSRFYMATYGCLLYLHMHLCTGLPRLYCGNPRLCCRTQSGVHRGRGCLCDLTAALIVSGLTEDDIIFANWDNALFRPVFYVAVDRGTNSVIIAIRGTLSFVDCVTDVAAKPELLLIPSSEHYPNTCVDDYYVHGGIKRSAEYVLKELKESCILDSVRCGELRNHRLVVLGHSLGAGVASVLSILLYAMDYDLRDRLRCLAYSPPGGLMSQVLARYSKDFILGCFVGNDMIPRMASHTFDDLREAVLDVLEASNTSKTLIFANRCILGRRIGSSAWRESPSSREGRAVRAVLQSKAYVPPAEERRLFPPFTLVHLRKAVVRWTPRKCFCLPFCCRSKRENVFVPAFETPNDVQVVVCSPSMFSSHYPDYVFDALEQTANRLQCGELDRFFSRVPCKTEDHLDTAYGATAFSVTSEVV